MFPIAVVRRFFGLAALVLGAAPHVSANQGVDASLLVYTEGKPIGFSIGYGARWKQIYFGGELLTHNFSDTVTDPVFSAHASAKLLNTSLLIKGFVPFTPTLELYAGAGVGYAATRIDYDVTSALGSGSGSTTANDWGTQVLAGIQYRVVPTGTVKLGWRYLDVPDADFAGKKLKANTNAIELGLNFEF